MAHQNRGNSAGKAKVFFAVIGLFVIALLPRVIGVDYGYFHGDERIGDAAKVLAGQLVPGQHFYPPLINYVNAIAFLLLYGFGVLVGLWSDTGGFRAAFFSDPTLFYVAARLMTAVIGALMAPLFFAAARGRGVPLHAAILAGLLGALLPLSIFMAHIAKGDAALATASVLVGLLFLARHSREYAPGLDIALGLAVALALSFKHSFLFILAPLFLCHLALLLAEIGFRAGMKSLGRGLLALFIVWPILNIGILLDFSNFLAFQKIQAVMSIRADQDLRVAFELLYLRALDLPTGITPVALGLWVAFPLYLLLPICRLKGRLALALLWLSVLVSFVIMLPMVGGRQPEHLWLPQFSLMFLMVAVMVADLFRAEVTIRRFSGAILALAIVIPSLVGTARILHEALAAPIRAELSELLERNFAKMRVFTTTALDLPQSKAARAWEVARLERLAKKYAIEIPEEAPERKALRDVENGYYFINAPGVMFGLEEASDEDLKGKVQAYAWPLQPEEWELDFWLDQDVRVFVVSNLPYHLNDTPSAVFRGFYGELVARCEVHAEIKARKKLFLENDLSVMVCAARDTQSSSEGLETDR